MISRRDRRDGGWLVYTRDILCDTPECERTAAYKIAAPWSTGSFSELKCYSLSCADHVGDALRDARRRADKITHSSEESVGEIGVYAYERGKHDRQLERVRSIEG